MSAGASFHPATRFFALPDDFRLDSGERLPQARLAYRSWGTPARRAVLVCHALSGSADADVWWPDMLGEAAPLDPRQDFIICSNVLGSCYGSSGPASGAPFPVLTVRDLVRAQALLLDALGVERLALLIGGSLGGMQVLEWLLLFPQRIDAAVVIAAAAEQTPWALALSEVQRAAIAAAAPDRARGLAVARMAAMCSYRHWREFSGRFGRRREGEDFAVNRWLQRHGDRFVERFDIDSYLCLLDIMDRHDLQRGREPLPSLLERCAVPTLLLGIDSDLLYPPLQQRRLAQLLPRGCYVEIRSDCGHDGFLLEPGIAEQVRRFRARLAVPAAPLPPLQFSY